MYQLASFSVAPGSMQISPCELTRSQGELVRSSFGKCRSDNCETPNCWKTEHHSSCTFGFVRSDNVDSGSVPDSLPEAGLPEALEPSEGETTNRWIGSRQKSHP